jgi:hypothetical protein
LWSLSGSSEGSGRCGWIEIPRLWYHLLSSNRTDLTRRTRNKTIPASYRLTVRGSERTAVLRISHGSTAIPAEVRVMSINIAVRTAGVCGLFQLALWPVIARTILEPAVLRTKIRQRQPFRLLLRVIRWI